MKKIYILCFVILTALSSCKKILDLKPIDKITPENAFSTANGLDLYANSFYNSLLPGSSATPFASGQFSADKLSDYAAVTSISTYLLANGFDPSQASGWDWGNLRSINYFLENNNNSAIPLSVRAHYNGVAKFFRAYFYYGMVKKYGPVPYFNKTLAPNDEDIYKGRDSRTLVMDSVLADLNYACNNINDTKDASASRITRSVALAFKSRVCLFEGTFRKYHTEKIELGSGIPDLNSDLSSTAAFWFQEAADAATKLMASGKYKIYNTNNSDKDYRTLFTSETPIADEVLLTATSNNAQKRWHDANWWFTSSTYGVRLSLTKTFVNTYLNVNGTRFTDQADYDKIPFVTETANRDKRLEQTIRLGAYKRSDGTAAAPDFGYTFTGYQVKKFTLDDKSLDSKAENYNSIPLIRYAEVLLNYAEAKAELSQFTNSDWTQTIQVLRTRAGIATSAFPTIADPYLKTRYYPNISDASLLEIRRERGIELACEGLRYDDLIRWKAGNLLTLPFDGLYVPQKNTVYDLNNDGKLDVAFVDVIPAVKVTGVIYYLLNGSLTKLADGNSGLLLYSANINKVFPERSYYYPVQRDQIVLSPKIKNHPAWGN